MGASLLTQEEKDLITLRSKQGVAIKDISVEIGRHYSTIKHFEDKMGLSSNPKTYGVAKEDRKPIYDLYNSGLTLQQIHDEYYPQYSTGQINHICRTKGITRRNGKQIHLDENYFEEINSSHKAYWLGLLMADGCVQRHYEKGNSYTITLQLMSEDKYIIEEFAKDTKTDLKVRTHINNSGFQRQDGQPHSMSILSLSSVKMANDLIKYGVVPNKSCIEKHLPNIPREYMKYFILGYFDGNGSITYSTSHNGFAIRVIFYGDHTFLSDISTFISHELNMTIRTVVDQKTERVSLLTYGAYKDVEAFYHYFYDTSDIYLRRKKEKFEELIRQYRDKHVA